MPIYKQQFYRRVGGYLAHTYEFEAANDGEATAFAALWTDYSPMELWREGSMLKRWEAPLNGPIRATAAKTAQNEGDDVASRRAVE